LGSKTFNPVTGEEQYISISQDQEIALGVQAAPEMAAQYGGLAPEVELQAIVDEVGNRLVQNSFARESTYPFEFHLLDDPETVNAFALPGGQIFITWALMSRLESEDQLAGVLGHEIGHVIGRHGAEQIAKQELSQGLTGAVVLATYDPDNPSSAGSAQVALMLGQLINMRFGRDAELESDFWGVCILNEAGYDPNELVRVMEILNEASGGVRPPEFLSTHPDPGNRIAEIENAIANVDRCP
jgi:predicted Zn-dependent protease